MTTESWGACDKRDKYKRSAQSADQREALEGSKLAKTIQFSDQVVSPDPKLFMGEFRRSMQRHGGGVCNDGR
jgi:hypothetical protein